MRKLFLTMALFALCATSQARLPARLDIAYSSQNDGCHINSIEHFRAAVDAGFNCLKADMNITSDGVVVLCHDRGFTFDENGRICKFDRNNNTVIRNLSWKQIRSMEYASGKAEKGTYPKVASLDQLAQLCKRTGVWMYITLRAYDQRETLSEVVRILRKYKMTDRCIINNYPPGGKTCALIREYLPEVPISFTTTSRMTVDSALVDKVAAYAPVMICANKNHIPSPEVVSYAVEKGVRCLGWYPSDADTYDEWLSRGLSGAQITRREVIADYPSPGACLPYTAVSRYARTTTPYGKFEYGKPFVVEARKLHYGAVDIVIRLKERSFVNHLSLNLSDETEGGTAQILHTDNRPLTPEIPVVNGENTLVVAEYADSLILRLSKNVQTIRTPALAVLEADYTDFSVTDIRVHGATGLEDMIYPTPKSIAFGEGELVISGVGADSKCAFAADNFREKYEDIYGKRLPAGGNVNFSLAEMDNEAFTINVTPSGAVVRGGSVRALLYASEKLLQLCRDGRLRCVDISDKPAFPMRGFHFGLPPRARLDYVKRLVKYLLMPMGYNTVYLQVSGVMEYKKHPEINEAWTNAVNRYLDGKGPKPAHYGYLGGDIISQDEVRELCAYMRRYGMEIIPEVQTFGHVQYVTMAHPELGERAETFIPGTDRLKEDERPDVAFCHTACPNHPDYFPIFYDILDEVVDVIKPERYVHIGHDEIHELGLCPRCKAEGAANVYAREVTAMHDYLAKKGLKTMLWSDMMEEKNYASYASLPMVPKDMVGLSFTWYFHLSETLEIEDRLVDNGMQFLTGNFYSHHFPRFESRREKKGYLGGEVSMWVSCDEDSYAYKGKFYDLLYTAEMLWNRGYKENMRPMQTLIVASRIPALRSYMHYGRLKPVALPFSGLRVIPGYLAQVFPDAETIPLCGTSDEIPYDIRDIYKGGLCAHAGSSVAVSVGQKASRVHVLHATDIPDVRVRRQAATQVGTYVLEYEDGSSYEQAFVFGRELACYKWVYGIPLASVMFRHEGYTATYPSVPVNFRTAGGERATMWDYAIDNPNPEKMVSRLLVKCCSTVGASVVVAGVAVEKGAGL